jgi:hypothetical protein
MNHCVSHNCCVQLGYTSNNKDVTHQFILCSHLNLILITKGFFLSGITQHPKLRPFDLKAGRAVFTTIPTGCEWMSTCFSSIHCSYYSILYSLHLKKVMETVSFGLQAQITFNTLFITQKSSPHEIQYVLNAFFQIIFIVRIITTHCSL